jgi:hypothetical protein
MAVSLPSTGANVAHRRANRGRLLRGRRQVPPGGDPRQVCVGVLARVCPGTYRKRAQDDSAFRPTTGDPLSASGRIIFVCFSKSTHKHIRFRFSARGPRVDYKNATSGVVAVHQTPRGLSPLRGVCVCSILGRSGRPRLEEFARPVALEFVIDEKPAPPRWPPAARAQQRTPEKTRRRPRASC